MEFEVEPFISIISNSGKKITIDEDIEMVIEENFKDTLMANLYSTVDFLKKELEEKNFIIKNLLSQLEKQFVNQQDFQATQLVRTRPSTSSVKPDDYNVVDEWKSSTINTQEGNHTHQSKNNSDDYVNPSPKSHHTSKEDTNSIEISKNNKIINDTMEIVINKNDDNKTASNEWQTINTQYKGNNCNNSGTKWEIPLSNRFNAMEIYEKSMDDYNCHESVIPKTANQLDPIRKTDNDKSNNKNNIFINKNPESDKMIYRNIKSKHAEITNRESKTLILSASITKPINMNMFNNSIVNGSAIKRAFGGSTVTQLNYYVHESLNEYKPDTIIICAGTNNFTKKRHQTVTETAFEVMNLVETCRNKGVERIFVSSITCRPSFQEKVKELNELLQYNAGIYNYEFIDNSCIGEKHLKNDGVHLNSEGINILASNFLVHLNRPSILPFYSIWD